MNFIGKMIITCVVMGLILKMCFYIVRERLFPCHGHPY